MATDRWPTEEGYIVEGLCIGFCYADSASIAEGRGVKQGTSASSRVAVTVPAAVGDSIGVALKTPAAIGDMIPVAFMGVVKMVSTGTFNIGEYVMGGAAGRARIGDAAANTANLQINKAAGSAGSHILGLALQSATTEGDEVLILLGKNC